MSKIEKINFEKTSDGKQTHLFKITNSLGANVTLCDFGATVFSIKIYDKDKNIRDVVLGYEHLKDYENNGTYFGATVGRCCGRIAYGEFTLNDKNYELPVNNGNNHLHGGVCSFSRRLWEGKAVSNGVVFSLVSSDGEEGYPGKLEATVKFTFDDSNILEISYYAISNKDTICNLTNHSYFNLNGHDSKTVLDQTHLLQINADKYIPLNENLTPTGEIVSVNDTIFDFRKGKYIEEGMDYSNEQTRIANGLDNMFVLNNNKPAVVAKGLNSGITLECYTTQLGVHVYTANYVDESADIGKNSISYGKNSAFCLETQGYPDAVNHSNFPSTILKANSPYLHKTKFVFTV